MNSVIGTVLRKCCIESSYFAAGPHTHRENHSLVVCRRAMLELKTVQVMTVKSFPSVHDINTIGYNTEWSQKLLLEESLREYMKASMIVEMLKSDQVEPSQKSESFQFTNHNHTVLNSFDISVGYGLKDSIKKFVHG